MYDIFYTSLLKVNEDNWTDFKARFPIAHKIDHVKTFHDIKSKAFTKMFWVVWDDLVVVDSFNFEYKVPQWDLDYVHVFKNGDTFDGINIFPKNSVISDKEFKHRFFQNKKEIDISASYPRPYDFFNIETYEDYEQAILNTTTEMFWMSSKELKVKNNFNFNFYFSHHDIGNRTQTHAFVNLIEGHKHYNGLFLCSINQKLSKKEVEYKFPINRIEWNIVATEPTYNKVFTIETYQDYLDVVNSMQGTELFWLIPNDVVIDPNFNFDYYFPQNNEYDRKKNHVFLNGKEYDGIMLLSKHAIISEKEFRHRFIVEKKQWDIKASEPKPFDKFYIDTYEEYLEAMERSSTEMFWMLSRNLTLDKDFNLNLYFSHHNSYDRNENHGFKHKVGDKETYNGVYLLSKNKPVTKKEIDHRHLITKKEWDIVASGPIKYTAYVLDQKL